MWVPMHTLGVTKRWSAWTKLAVWNCLAAIVWAAGSVAEPAAAGQPAAAGSVAEALRDPGVQHSALALARNSLTHYLRDGHLPPLPADLPAVLKMRRAVIVTLEVPGHASPRGCRGTLESTHDSLASEIQHNAVAAATRDKRVRPLTESELANCRISLTVVLGLRNLQSLKEHDPENCGLIASQGERVGIVLPYEGHDGRVQWSWALKKAGLPPGASAAMIELNAVRFKEAT